MGVTVTGLAAAQRRLDALALRAADQTPVMTAEAARVQRTIAGVPVDTGRLARSVAGGADTLRRAGRDGYVVGSRVPYAPFVFGGTRRSPARPPRVPGDPAAVAARAVSADLRRL
jgi:hypothetical protein